MSAQRGQAGEGAPGGGSHNGTDASGQDAATDWRAAFAYPSSPSSGSESGGQEMPLGEPAADNSVAIDADTLAAATTGQPHKDAAILTATPSPGESGAAAAEEDTRGAEGEDLSFAAVATTATSTGSSSAAPGDSGGSGRGGSGGNSGGGGGGAAGAVGVDRVPEMRRAWSAPAAVPGRNDVVVIGASVRPKWFCWGRNRRNRRWVGLAAHLEKQEQFLRMFRASAERQRWADIHHHHYDWYLFPIEDGSKPQWAVAEADVQELRGSELFMKRYYECVELVASAWGWDVRAATPVDLPSAGWTQWDVRLAKIIRSLWLFEEKELMESMQQYARVVKPRGGLRYGHIRLDEVYNMSL